MQSATPTSTSRSHDAVIRVFDDAANVIETHERAVEFKEPYRKFARTNRAAVCLLGSAALLIIQDRLRCGPTHFDLGAHFLQARSKHFNLLLLLRDSRFLFGSS